jgi:hypothetical protein
MIPLTDNEIRAVEQALWPGGGRWWASQLPAWRAARPPVGH